jgi:hypothetical protein
MIIRPKGTALIEEFHKQINILIDDIIKNNEWIMENDPDPETTANYMVDKKLKEWFMRGGNMGY